MLKMQHFKGFKDIQNIQIIIMKKCQTRDASLKSYSVTLLSWIRHHQLPKLKTMQGLDMFNCSENVKVVLGKFSCIEMNQTHYTSESYPSLVNHHRIEFKDLDPLITFYAPNI
jgi:hypothetical protein